MPDSLAEVNPVEAEVMITAELGRRRRRSPDPVAENRALVSLASTIATAPEALLQRVAEAAMALCGAGSAGISLLERGADGSERLRWIAATGLLSAIRGQVVARSAVPCTRSLESGLPELFALPERLYPAVAAKPPIQEALSLPFGIDDQPVGTIWVAAHEEGRRFDLEDVRLLDDLAHFTAAAWQVQRSVRREQAALRRALETQRAWLATVLEQLPCGLVIAEPPHARIVLSNRRAEEILGHPADPQRDPDYHRRGLALDGTPLAAEDHPLARVFRSGVEIAQEEMLWRRGDDSIATLSVSAAPVRAQDGTIIAAVLTFQDVSEQRRQREALRQSEERLRFALEAAGMTAWEWDLRDDVIRRSATIAKLIGEGAETGCHDEFMDMVHPDDRDSVSAALNSALTDGGEYFAEFRVAHPNRQMLLWVADQGRVEFGTDGKPAWLRGVVRDITERKHAQEGFRRRASELQAIMDAVPAVVFLAHDRDCQKVTGSRRAHEMLRLPTGSNLSVAETHGQPAGGFHIRHNGVTVGMDQFPLQIAAHGVEVRGYEEEIAFADGTTLRLYGNATPIRDQSGALRGAVAAFIDITDRVRAEEQLRAAKEAAEEANRAKSRFLAAASHDLRQPLQALHLYMGLLTERLNGREDNLQRSIARCLKGLTRLLDDLLDISKLDAGLIAPAPEAVALDDLIDGVANDFRLQAAEKGIELRVVRCPQATGMSDPTLLGRILSNIVSNAVRYTRSGRLLIGCRRRGAMYRIEVWDTGVGIPEEKIPEIFREFHQLDNDERNSERGTGLGLAIVDRLARLLRHSLQVRSWPGCGSMFAVEIPACARQALSQPAEQQSVPPAARGCVAVLDDETIVREALRSVLEDWGYEVAAAATPAGLERALETVRRVPDVIIADYRLGEGLKGTHAIAALRSALGAELPAIVLTGDTSPERIREVAESGYQLLHKPVDVDRLKALVRLATIEVAGRG